MGLQPQRIAVIGAGSWGTALALLLADNGHQVRLWGHNLAQIKQMQIDKRNSRYLPDHQFPDHLIPCETLAQALTKADHALVVVPSSAFANTVERIYDSGEPLQGLVWGTKGLDPSGILLHQVAEKICGSHFPYAVISGPSFAKEVAKKLPTALTIAATQQGYCQRLSDLFSNNYFRAYISDDLVGTQVGGAVKNILAIATGVSDGLGFGANARSALITRGLAEMRRLALALGADEHTLMGLSGAGDLILTCTDDQSRNRRFGLALASGQSVDEAQQHVGQVVEGVKTAQHIYQLANRQQVDMPIVREVYRLLQGEYSPRSAVKHLLSRPIKTEF